MSGSKVQVRAFTLVEVTLALGMAAVSLIAIFALLPVGLQTSYRVAEQAASNDILAAVIADLRATAQLPHAVTAQSLRNLASTFQAIPAALDRLSLFTSIVRVGSCRRLMGPAIVSQ